MTTTWVREGLTLNRDKLDALRQKFGLPTEIELARRVGLEVDDLLAICENSEVLTEVTTARFILAFPDATLRELFDVTSERFDVER